MQSKTHDQLYRLSERYIDDAIANEEVARLMTECYGSLAHLITDDLTAEVFQVTYCRMTHRYHGGDFCKRFRRIFWSTMRDYQHRIKDYKARINALSEEIQAHPSDADQE